MLASVLTHSCRIPGLRANSTSVCETHNMFPAVLCYYAYENSVVLMQRHLLVRHDLEY